MKIRWKVIIVVCSAVLLFTCIDPFIPDLDKFDNLLVVEAQLTDEAVPGFVKLSRTVKTTGEDPEKVTGASVRIMDNAGSITTLSETEAGYYITDFSSFRGETGKEYTLLVTTPDGKEYESDPCVLYPVQDIDSLYFIADSKLSADGLSDVPGARFLIDSDSEGGTGYFRWTVEEWWKIEIPYPVKFVYHNDTAVIPVPIVNDICWNNVLSHEIMIQADFDENHSGLYAKPVLFVPSALTNRFSSRYYISVKQYSLSRKEYEFWDLMSQLNETGGDIFEKQPFPVDGNIRCVSHPDEQVLGYFQVSGVSERHIYLKPSDITERGLPLYRYDCDIIIRGPDDYPPPLSPGAEVTFYKIHRWYHGNGYLFTEPQYNNDGSLKKLVFVRDFCSDCRLTGKTVMPDFWVD